MSEFSDAMKEEVAIGAEEAVVDEGTEVVMEFAEDVLGDFSMGSMILNSDQGREASKVVFGGLLYFLVKSGMTPDLDVASGKVARIARIVARNGVRGFLKPHLSSVRSYAEQLGEVAESLPESEE